MRQVARNQLPVLSVKKPRYAHAPASLPLGEVPFVAIDFEAAGAARGMTDAPVQVGMASMRGCEIDTGSFFRSFIKPGHEVAWTAQRVHGIGPETVEDAPMLGELWPELQQRLGNAVVVAHGAPTEKRYLRAFPGHGFGPWVDTLWLARKVLPDAQSHRLGDLVELLGMEGVLTEMCPGLQWHDALYDAVASLLILQAVIAEPGMAGQPLSCICPELA